MDMKEKKNDGVNPNGPNWSSCGFGMELLQPRDMNCGNEQLPNCFYNPNWENSMDQTDPFESALSSMVSSPVTSNAGLISGGDSVVLGELIGRLGNICNSGEISPHNSYINIINNNNSCNTSCYNTPLSSPPKLSLSSMADSQLRVSRNLQIPANHHGLTPFTTDPGFAERAARLSCFGNRSFNGLNDSIEFPQRPFPIIESDKLSRVSSNQSMRVVGGSQMNAQEISCSTPENPEFGDSRENSSVSEQIPVQEFRLKNQNGVHSRKRKSSQKVKSLKETTTTNSTPITCDSKIALENEETSTKKSKQHEAECNENSKGKQESNGNSKNNKNKNNNNEKQNNDNSKAVEPLKDYIHVRARRGQATDSHSLAERVRREKISERMKFLQDLVPGCSKVTGKAVMLDEIINYVQSLQRQVEFLSMKLATVNPKMDINMNTLLSKEMFQSRGSFPHNLYPIIDQSSHFPFGYQMQQSLAFHNSETQFAMNPLNPIDPPQNGMFWEDDLQSVVQMAFGQNQTESNHESVDGVGRMKVES